MSLKSPITYAEFYWKYAVQAETLNAELTEKEISPLVKTLISDITAIEDLPDGFRKVLDTLSEPTAQKLGGFGSNLLGEVFGNALGTILEQPLKKSRYSMGRLFLGERIDASTTALLWQRKKIEESMYEERYGGLGYSVAEWNAYYAGQQPYPTIPDLMLWARYHGDPDNTRDTVWEKFDVPAVDYEVWEWQTLQRLTTEQSQSLYKRGLLAEPEFINELAQIGWSKTDRDRIKDLAFLLPNAMLQIQGGLMQGIADEKILEDISKSDIHPQYAQKYLDAVLTKPASQDIIAYQLRQDPNLTTLPQELKKIGIHPDYSKLYKTLAYPIPPTADLIMMAVREAFTPDVAAKFGQYEDFPAEFEKYAGMRGLSSEWAERYWAAHWNLPSPTQGFEMLHRGVIDRTELNMLLRAQDVMPFWRDKLIEIAYRPLTRVDVRRMYKLGVLDEGEVYEAYLDAGYADENARRMAEFTVKQTLATQMKFKSGDIVKAFVKRMISRSEAVSLLAMIDISYENANQIIQTAEYKREWAFTEQQIRGIRNLYKKKVYDAGTAQGKLAGLNLPSDQIQILMQQWYYEIKDEPTQTWTTSQTLGFVKKGLITLERGRLELHRIGYDIEHINVYMESIK